MTYNRTVGSFTPQPWMEHGSCADSPMPDLWFDDEQAAKRVCRTCPTVGECRAFALADPSLQGVWGATNVEERKDLRAYLPVTLGLIPHGTSAGYRAHYRRGSRPCGECRSAEARRRSEQRQAARTA